MTRRPMSPRVLFLVCLKVVEIAAWLSLFLGVYVTCKGGAL